MLMICALFCWTLWYLWIFISRTWLYITFQYCLWAYNIEGIPEQMLDAWNIHVCMYVCMYMCVCVRMYICMHVCMYVHVCMCMYVYLHVSYDIGSNLKIEWTKYAELRFSQQCCSWFMYLGMWHCVTEWFLMF